MPNVATNSTANENPTGDNTNGDEATATSTNVGETTTISGDKTLDTLGIGETKVAKPDENPLDKKMDNLLDGIK